MKRRFCQSIFISPLVIANPMKQPISSLEYDGKRVDKFANNLYVPTSCQVHNGSISEEVRMANTEQYKLKRVLGRDSRSPIVVTDPIEVSVDYTPPASLEVFRAEFKGRVSTTLFDGRELTKHELCRGMDESSGMRKMVLARIAYSARQYPDIVTVVHELLRGRPATALEARALAKAHPAAFEEHTTIHAVGDTITYAERDDVCYCAWLQNVNEYGDEPMISVLLDRMDDLSEGDSCFLFVLPD